MTRKPMLPLSVVVHIDYQKAPSVIQRFGDVKRLITGIDGFKAYYLIRAEDGEALSVSVYDDKTGADRSATDAADFRAR